MKRPFILLLLLTGISLAQHEDFKTKRNLCKEKMDETLAFLRMVQDSVAEHYNLTGHFARAVRQYDYASYLFVSGRLDDSIAHAIYARRLARTALAHNHNGQLPDSIQSMPSYANSKYDHQLDRAVAKDFLLLTDEMALQEEIHAFRSGRP